MSYCPLDILHVIVHIHAINTLTVELINTEQSWKLINWNTDNDRYENISK